MADLVAVAVVDRLHYLPEDVLGLDLRKVPVVDDPVEELAASAQLHHEVDVALVLEGLEELHDVRVLHGLMGPAPLCDWDSETAAK